MNPLRTRFKRDIVAEFLPPSRASGRKAIILCSGMPSVPSKKAVLEFLSKKGYWVFFPRYRGSWESGGKFLSRSPHQDVLDVIDAIPRGFQSLWDGTRYAVEPNELYVIGASFGGTASILASRDSRVTKAVALSPVVDWTRRSRTEPLEKLEEFTRAGFGEAYRFSKRDWSKLQNGTFYNPMALAKEIDGSKLLIVHAKDDESVDWKGSEKFAKRTEARLKLLKRGGHFSTSVLADPRFFKQIQAFLRGKQ